jgi:hypothetical protein
MQKLHPKVKVPAIYGQVITGILAVLAVVGTIPAYAPLATEAISLIQTISGYLTYS